MSDSQSCANCRFSRQFPDQRFGGLDDMRRCQRNTPDCWTVIELSDWCGEWEGTPQPFPRTDELNPGPELERAQAIEAALTNLLKPFEGYDDAVLGDHILAGFRALNLGRPRR